MSSPALFGISVTISFILWGTIAWNYIWPALKERPSAEALKFILLLHGFRFVGLAFVVPGVVSPDLPAAFARSAAYGDLTTAILALLALVTLGTRTGRVATWTFNIIGTAGLLFAFCEGNRTALANMPGLLGAAYFIVIGLVPLLLVTHGLAFRMLLRTEAVVPSSAHKL